MIDVSQTADAGHRVYEMIQGLFSIPHNKWQPLGTQTELLEVCEIFHMTSKCHLQTLLHTTMPVAILDRRIRPGHGTEEGARGQAKEHVVKEEGWSDTRMQCNSVHRGAWPSFPDCTQ